jgi:hypothetical protein
LKPKRTTTSGWERTNKKETNYIMTAAALLFSDCEHLWKVIGWQGFIAAQPHDIWLSRARKGNKPAKNAYILGLCPVGTILQKKVANDVLRTECEGVARLVTLTEIHGVRRQC